MILCSNKWLVVPAWSTLNLCHISGWDVHFRTFRCSGACIFNLDVRLPRPLNLFTLPVCWL